MSTSRPKTRFAPSPTGLMHLGNARTALFNALLARRAGGAFVLRIEDTDAARSRPEFQAAIEADLRWLGLDWQEGPGVGGAHAPYRQSERGAVYEAMYHRLREAGHLYPCFCSAETLQAERKAQRAAGRAPRYSGRCRSLSAAQAAERLAGGEAATLRFRVPEGREVGFEDLVRGPQSVACADIGDFVVRRADGTPAFFFSNAVDDALMGITHVLRGEDHLSNTARQLLLLEALDLPAPRYGHLPLILGEDGAPLSKRQGSRSIAQLREAGFLPEALVNYLARLGHTYAGGALLTLDELAAGFELDRLGRAPARFDPEQLRHWQHQAVAAAAPARLWEWMGEAVQAGVPPEQRAAFVEAVRPNVMVPADAADWARVLFRDPLELDAEARAAVAEADAGFFAVAAQAADEHGADFAGFAAALKARTGARGRRLFHPLRAALTGRVGGPELARLFPLLGVERLRGRLQAAARARSPAAS